MNDALLALILTVETRLGAVEDVYADRGNDHLVWRQRQQAYGAIISDLVAQEKARYRPGHNGTYELTLAGIRTSCTAGEQGLLTAWLRKAKVMADARRVS